jgi:hypothetical protein
LFMYKQRRWCRAALLQGSGGMQLTTISQQVFHGQNEALGGLG